MSSFTHTHTHIHTHTQVAMSLLETVSATDDPVRASLTLAGNSKMTLSERRKKTL